MKIELYNLDEANLIINYYQDDLINQVIGSTIKLKISKLETIQNGKKFRIVCRFKSKYGDILIQSIGMC